jgi:hypothetical protein
VPYEMHNQGHRWVVTNQKTGQMVPGGDHPTREQALKHMRALYANVKDADGVWQVVDWFTGDVVATLADELAAFDVYDIMMASGQLTDADLSAEEMASLGKAGKAFRNAAGEWSYPTPDASYVRKAMKAFGRSSPQDRSRLKAYLKRRASAEGLSKEEIARVDGYSSS